MSLTTWTVAVAAAPADDNAFFESRVRPVLIEHCYSCHTDGKKAKGGLALDHRQALLRGGDSGPAVVHGDPEKSRLIEAVRYKNHDLQMPPDGRLTDAQVRDLTAWVKMGAPDPRQAVATPVVAARPAIDLDEGRKFWSFAPLADPAPPEVKDTAWPISPVDNFVLAELERAGLRPAPPADRATLIRRATFDLIGLPPTPADVDAFVGDARPDSFARLVDRLLASPQYGQRWARHWLDVARYADSNG
ncbi:MAG TPA: DUF1549 domain-containing protein, partial [Tepidisphaeraceae bacterium]|nr:DUF1549 domain-containing protein [Tepidisphaeraceae bacterium]